MTDQVDVQVGDNNFTDLVDVDDVTALTIWDPFGGVKVPDGFTYIVKLGSFHMFWLHVKIFCRHTCIGQAVQPQCGGEEERIKAGAM